MANKPIILTFNKFYLPGYRAGGPIRTLANMVDRLGEEFDFQIVTLDRDSGDAGPYTGVDSSAWNTIGRAQVRYLSSREVSLRSLRRIILAVSPNVIYLNSFFDPVFTQRILLLRRMGGLVGIPVVLASRGEFSIGALDLKSGKKRAYLGLASWAGLYRGVTWQASSEHEKADILRALNFVPERDIQIAINLAPKLDHDSQPFRSRSPGDPLRVCFLSRISPMKNLDFALECLRHVRADILFTIFGPKEVPGYWARCETIIASLPANVRVVYAGEVEHSMVRETLAAHDLFFFPTRGENYGHVIHEALTAGLPALISNQTPWRDLEAEGVGWSIPLGNPRLFADAMDEAARMSIGGYSQIRSRAASYAAEKSDDSSVLEANRSMFMFCSSGDDVS